MNTLQKVLVNSQDSLQGNGKIYTRVFLIISRHSTQIRHVYIHKLQKVLLILRLAGNGKMYTSVSLIILLAFYSNPSCIII